MPRIISFHLNQRKPEDDVVADAKDDIKKSKSDHDGSGEQQITNGNKVNGEQKMEVPVEIEAS